MAKLTIGMFTEAYHPTINGVVISINTFAGELRRRGHRVIIFAPQHPLAQAEEDVIRLPAIGLPKNKDYFFVTASPGLVTGYARDLGIDLIHSHHIFRMGDLAREVARRLDIPMVQTYHTLITSYTHYVPAFQTLFRNYLVYRSRSFLNRADQVISPSPSIMKLLRSYGVTQPIAVLPTGIEVAEYRKPASDQQLRDIGINPDVPFILSVGRVAIEKNLELLFKAYLKFHQVRPDVHLVIIGNGPEMDYFQSWTHQHKITSRIHFTGFLPPEIIRHVFARAMTFVLPSLTDTQAIVIQEAMAAGSPPIAVNKFGPGDYIDHEKTGLLINNNVDELVQALDRVAHNAKFRDQLGKAAQKKSQEFSVSATTDRLLTIYTNLLK